jgi:hypothetical protein
MIVLANNYIIFGISLWGMKLIDYFFCVHVLNERDRKSIICKILIKLKSNYYLSNTTQVGEIGNFV